MGDALDAKMGEVSLDNGPTPFGKEMLKHFQIDSRFRNLNHGIFLSQLSPIGKLTPIASFLWYCPSSCPPEAAGIPGRQ